MTIPPPNFEILIDTEFSMNKTNNINPRSGMDVDSFREDIEQHLRYTLAKDKYSATQWDDYRSVVLAVMDRLHERWIDTQQGYYDNDV